MVRRSSTSFGKALVRGSAPRSSDLQELRSLLARNSIYHAFTAATASTSSRCFWRCLFAFSAACLYSSILAIFCLFWSFLHNFGGNLSLCFRSFGGRLLFCLSNFCGKLSLCFFGFGGSLWLCFSGSLSFRFVDSVRFESLGSVPKIRFGGKEKLQWQCAVGKTRFVLCSAASFAALFFFCALFLVLEGRLDKLQPNYTVHLHMPLRLEPPGTEPEQSGTTLKPRRIVDDDVRFFNVAFCEKHCAIRVSNFSLPFSYSSVFAGVSGNISFTSCELIVHFLHTIEEL